MSSQSDSGSDSDCVSWSELSSKGSTMRSRRSKPPPDSRLQSGFLPTFNNPMLETELHRLHAGRSSTSRQTAQGKD
eukprot:1034694-Rhodomonas_salina.2